MPRCRVFSSVSETRVRGAAGAVALGRGSEEVGVAQRVSLPLSSPFPAA